MRIATIACLVALSATAAACTKDPPPPRPPGVCKPPPEADVPVIGLSLTDACPRAKDAKEGRWDVAPVFPADAAQRLPAAMRRLCSYTWSGCGLPDGAALPLADLAEAADDPPIVQALGAADKARSEVVTSARARLVRTADALSPLPETPSATAVFVAFPDTSPAPPTSSDDIAVDVVSHGFDMAWITRFLACPSGSLRACAAKVRTDLALGHAGGRGTRAELGASVVRLVRGWKKDDGRRGPLVIPIAAGWEPVAERVLGYRKGPVAESDSLPAEAADAMPAPVAPGDEARGARLSPGARAALFALDFAACHGALVIAAAGSDPGYKDPPSGAMLPAAWESLPSPSAAACKAWFGDAAVEGAAASKSQYTPLVHAVGGVDDRDHPIFGTRQKSLPRIVAPAQLLAAYPDDPSDAGYARLCAPGADMPKAFVCERSTPRTGTSVAAAVTAGIAAVVWSHHPGWSGHDVMNALYTGGVPLGEKADVSLSGPGKDTLARVGLCSALAASCKGAPKGACPEKLACQRLPAFAKGPRPSPFVAARPGLLSLAVDSLGAAPDGALACPGCLFHTKQLRSDGCELTGAVPAMFFQTAAVARIEQPSLDLFDALGRRLGFVETPGFRPQSWSASEPGEQPVYADAASCANAAQVVLRWSACADASCAHAIPMFREIPIVE